MIAIDPQLYYRPFVILLHRQTPMESDVIGIVVEYIKHSWSDISEIFVSPRDWPSHLVPKKVKIPSEDMLRTALEAPDPLAPEERRGDNYYLIYVPPEMTPQIFARVTNTVGQIAENAESHKEIRSGYYWLRRTPVGMGEDFDKVVATLQQKGLSAVTISQSAIFFRVIQIWKKVELFSGMKVRLADVYNVANDHGQTGKLNWTATFYKEKLEFALDLYTSMTIPTEVSVYADFRTNQSYGVAVMQPAGLSDSKCTIM